MFKNPVKIADSSPFQVALHILVCPALLVGAWMMWDDESIKFSSMARMFAFLGVVFIPYTLLLARRYHICGGLFVSDGKLVVTPWKENLASVRIPIDRLEFPEVKIQTDDEGRLVLLTALNGNVRANTSKPLLGYSGHGSTQIGVTCYVYSIFQFLRTRWRIAVTDW